MTTQNHHIKNFVLNLQLGMDRDEAYVLKNEMLDLINRAVREELDPALSKSTAPDLTLRIDQVEFSLGNFDRKNWKSQFYHKFRSSLRKLIPEKLVVGHRIPSASPGPEMPGERDRRKAYTRFDHKERFYTLFFHFLQYGHFPWWGNPDHWSEWEQFGLDMLPQIEIRPFKEQLIALVTQRQQAFWRLFSEYSVDFLQKMIETLGGRPEGSPMTVSETSKPIVPVGVDQSISSIAGFSRRDMLMFSILEVLYVTREKLPPWMAQLDPASSLSKWINREEEILGDEEKDELTSDSDKSAIEHRKREG